MLADQPLCGKAFKTRNIRLEGLRRFPVAGCFQEYLIFYRPTQPGVEIVRVVHGFRDIEAILVEENGG